MHDLVLGGDVLDKRSSVLSNILNKNSQPVFGESMGQMPPSEIQKMWAPVKSWFVQMNYIRHPTHHLQGHAENDVAVN